MKSRIIIIGGIAILLGSIVYTLIGNKKKIKEKAELSLQIDKVMPVIVTSPKQGNLSTSIEVNGKFIPANELTILSKAHGIVVHKYKKSGDKIKKGDAILKIEDNLIREDLKVAELNLQKAQKDVERYHNLLNAGAVTKKQYEEMVIALQNAQARIANVKDQLNNSLIIAPVSGVLSEVFIENGGLVTQGGKIATIIDESDMSLLVNVTEKEVTRLKKGQKAIVAADVFSDQKVEGEIVLISSIGDKALNYEVEISIGNKYGNLVKSGMYGSAIFAKEDQSTRLLIDRKTLAGSIKNPTVFVIKDHKAFKKSITIGEVTSEYIEVLNGLNINDRVVLSGQINLKDSTEVIEL
jgi:membrane fusion protein (multidrug efflux system)